MRQGIRRRAIYSPSTSGPHHEPRISDPSTTAHRPRRGRPALARSLTPPPDQTRSFDQLVSQLTGQAKPADQDPPTRRAQPAGLYQGQTLTPPPPGSAGPLCRALIKAAGGAADDYPEDEIDQHDQRCGARRSSPGRRGRCTIRRPGRRQRPQPRLPAAAESPRMPLADPSPTSTNSTLCGTWLQLYGTIKSKKRSARPIQRVNRQHDQRKGDPGDHIADRLDQDDAQARPTPPIQRR